MENPICILPETKIVPENSDWDTTISGARPIFSGELFVWEGSQVF